MSDTQALLGKIASLRQRLEQAQGLASEAVASLLTGPGGGRLGALEHQGEQGNEQNTLIDQSVRQLPESAGISTETRAMPAQLTARARRLLERGRDVLLRL